MSVGEDGTLSVQGKACGVLGILTSRGLQYGVEAHMRRALDYGATKEAWFEVIKAAAAGGAREVVADLYWTRSARFAFLVWPGHPRHGGHAPQTLSYRVVKGLAHAPALLIG